MGGNCLAYLYFENISSSQIYQGTPLFLICSVFVTIYTNPLLSCGALVIHTRKVKGWTCILKPGARESWVGQREGKLFVFQGRQGRLLCSSTSSVCEEPSWGELKRESALFQYRDFCRDTGNRDTEKHLGMPLQGPQVCSPAGAGEREALWKSGTDKNNCSWERLWFPPGKEDKVGAHGARASENLEYFLFISPFLFFFLILFHHSLKFLPP